MREDVQQEVLALWEQVDSDNIKSLSDIEGFRKEFFHLFGFEFAEISYEAETEAEVAIPSLPSA